jgi:hypothetical protein
MVQLSISGSSADGADSATIETPFIPFYIVTFGLAIAAQGVPKRYPA